MGYYGIDYTYILVLIGATISAIASLNVNNTFQKYQKINNKNNYTANEVALMILDKANINDVRIEHISGSLTDHYDPSNRVLRLSNSVDHNTSVAAIGVAAHECGHALQHQDGYFFLKLRSLSVPIANFGSKLSWPLILLGLVLGMTSLAKLGIILFLAVVFFQLITLPVEFDASKRAIKILKENNILVGNELTSATSVLKAAALTYVASLFSAILQLLRLILITSNNRNRNKR